jgi:pimeloyl-ACP methyl ester carboxylesterase
MRILFAHGLESGPSGRKTAWLRDAGHEVVAPDCRQLGLADRIETIASVLVELGPTIVVGSSFGGIAALVAVVDAHARGVTAKGLLLCAPALQLPPPPPWPSELAPPCPCIVVHGTRDEVIPIELSRTFAARHGIELVERDDDHSLSSSREAILAAIETLATATA